MRFTIPCLEVRGIHFTEEILADSLDAFTKNRISERNAIGGLGDWGGSVAYCTHFVHEVIQRGTEYDVVINTLATPMGVMLKKCLEEGVQVAACIEGFGTLDNGTDRNVQPGFLINSINVTTPSVPSSERDTWYEYQQSE